MNNKSINHYKKENIVKQLDTNKSRIMELLNHSCDISFREFYFNESTRATMIYIEEFIDLNLIDRDLITPLLLNRNKFQLLDNKDLFKQNIISLVRTSNVSWSPSINYIIDCLLTQYVVILFDNFDEALVARLNRNNTTEREISEPSSEHVIRGPKDGFTENILTNLSLIRKRLKTPTLVIEEFIIGNLSKTNVNIIYLKGIAKEDIVKEVTDRLSTIEVDDIISTGYIEEYIEDNPYSPFPQVGTTQRPDIVCGHILEGHIAILANNAPTALLVPHTFVQDLQINEDYYERPIVASFIRIMRFLFLGIALFLPAIYIALETYHHEMISTKLLISMLKSREGIPFPAYFEALFMALFLEALRESSIRLPEKMGQTVSIVGALVIGEVAIKAGITSDTMVLVIGLTAVSSFTIPKYSQALTIRLLRFLLMLLSSFLGLYGVLLGFFFLLTHMCNLTSFGVSYMYPLSPLDINALKDTIIRLPRRFNRKRPSYSQQDNTETSKPS